MNKTHQTERKAMVAEEQRSDVLTGVITPADWADFAHRRFPSPREMTPWFPEDTHPARVGWYERFFIHDVLQQYWDGKQWLVDGRVPYVKSLGNPIRPCWRGLRLPSGESR